MFIDSHDTKVNAFGNFLVVAVKQLTDSEEVVFNKIAIRVNYVFIMATVKSAHNQSSLK